MHDEFKRLNLLENDNLISDHLVYVCVGGGGLRINTLYDHLLCVIEVLYNGV